MGITLVHTPDDGAEELLRNADAAMYKAKNQGKAEGGADAGTFNIAFCYRPVGYSLVSLHIFE